MPVEAVSTLVQMMSLFPSHTKMDYSIYRTFEQKRNTESSMSEKPKKHVYHCQHKWTHKDFPECPKWHQTALRLTTIALIFLIGTVLGLTLWAHRLSTYSSCDKHREKTEKILGSENKTADCNCVTVPPRHQQNNKNCSTNPSLNLCPNDGLQMKGKCYNFFKTFKSWTESQNFCSKMKSHLLMIQDQVELDFIQRNIQDGIYFWIGLNITHSPKTWTWLDGTPLNLQLFQVQGHMEDNTCALITKKGIFSEKCLIPSHWICQGVISSSVDDDL